MDTVLSIHEYSGTSLIKTSLIQTLANPNGYVNDIHCNFGVHYLGNKWLSIQDD